MSVNKPLIETVKTVVIAVLITAVVAFVGGVKYQQANNAAMQSAVKAASISNPVASK